MRRLWLIFAQATTAAMGVLFALHLLAPALERDGPPQSAAASAPRPATRGWRSAAARAMPAVVSVSTESERARLGPAGSSGSWLGHPRAPRPTLGLGSGVLVAPAGYVLTNDHVIAGAEHIEVRLSDGRHATARVVGRDPDTDLALLRLELPASAELPTLALGDDHRARVGDVVLAIGYPFAVGQTVTQGIVSAVGRHRLGINTFENFIQTDAAINPGNSGGALIDSSGRLIGINTAIFSRSGGSMGIGFAIPVSTASSVMRQLIAHGHVLRGWLGVQPQDLTGSAARRMGVRPGQGLLVDAVLRDGPAARAGVRPGDLLLELDGTPLHDSDQLLDRVAALAPGSTATLHLLRHGKPRELQVRIGQRPLDAATEDTQPGSDAEPGATRTRLLRDAVGPC